MEIVQLENDRGEILEVELTPECGHLLGVIHVDGVPYHVERVQASLLSKKYCVDVDPDYHPQSDENDSCILLAPYSL